MTAPTKGGLGYVDMKGKKVILRPTPQVRGETDACGQRCGEGVE